MRDTFEVVFEDIGLKNAVDLALHLAAQAEQVSCIELSQESRGFEAGSIGSIELAEMLGAEDDVSVGFKVGGLHAGDAIIANALIRVLKYGRQFDVDLSFDVGSGAEAIRLMKVLHRESRVIAKRFHVASFFGGMEPATDAATQYFVNEAEGPLMKD